MRSRYIILAAIAAPLFILMLAGLIPPDKNFAWHAKNALGGPESSIALKRLKSGNWQKVCFLESDSLTPGWTRPMIAEHFKIPIDKTNFIGPQAKADDFQTVLIFFTPPHDVEIMSVLNSDLFITSLQNEPYYYDWPPCTNRDSAYLVRKARINKKGRNSYYYFITTAEPYKL